MVARAKADLHIAYAHASHGSQVTEGMTAMNTFINGGGLGTTLDKVPGYQGQAWWLDIPRLGQGIFKLRTQPD